MAQILPVFFAAASVGFEHNVCRFTTRKLRHVSDKEIKHNEIDDCRKLKSKGNEDVEA